MSSQHTNPLVVTLPHTFLSSNDYPTEILANRFQAWRDYIKGLVSYLKEYASVQEEVVRQQIRLQQAMKFTSGSVPSKSDHSRGNLDESVNQFSKFFLSQGNGSVEDLPVVFNKFHQENVTNASNILKEINTTIIPKLDELRKDLLVKIKEIKNLQNDFHSSLSKDVNETRSVLSQFNQAIEAFNSLSGHVLTFHESDGKNDPYLLKGKLIKQLKKQLNEESYLYDAYANLQHAGGKLESIVVSEIQTYLGIFVNAVDAEAKSFSDHFIPTIRSGILAKEPTFEWDSFIARNLHGRTQKPLFMDLSFPTRKISDLSISGFDSPVNEAVRSGNLERRSKYLKSYSSGWYVLTCSYLHEFKTSDRKKDTVPVMSLSLDSCTVSDHSKDDGKPRGVYKFILSSKGTNGLISRGHNWVFRTDSYQNMIQWYTDLKKLTSLPTALSRARFVGSIISTSDNKTLTSDKDLSRVPTRSSHVSRGKSLKTVSTANAYEDPRVYSLKSQPLSRNGPLPSLRRHSDTFSNHETQSLRLGNMINSDGTMITPVDTSVERDEPPSSDVPTESKAPNSPSMQFFGSGHDNGNNSAYYNMSTPTPGQQFYDPVLQQFFTLMPSSPPSGLVPQQLNNGHPSLSHNSHSELLAYPDEKGGSNISHSAGREGFNNYSDTIRSN